MRRLRSGPAQRKLQFETFEDRKLLAAILIHETADRTLINDNVFGADFYQLSLDTAPTADVNIELSSSNPLARVSSSYPFRTTVTFTPLNWNEAQWMVVVGTVDNIATGNQTALLHHTIVTSDPVYANVTVRDVVATIIDTDSQPFLITYDAELVEGQSIIFFDSPRYPSGYNGPSFGYASDPQLSIQSINGSSTLTLTAVNDGIPEGPHEGRLRYGAIDPNPDGYSIPDVVVKITDAQIPVIASTVVNGGAIQRSIVDKIDLSFVSTVGVNPAFYQLTNLTTNTSVSVQVSVDATSRNVRVTFPSGPSVISRPQGNSLADGDYVLRILAGGVFDLATGTPMANDFVLGDIPSRPLFRLFGDLNGNARIDTAEIQAMNQAFRTSLNNVNYIAALDENGDGFIGVDDQTRFRRNIKKK